MGGAGAGGGNNLEQCLPLFVCLFVLTETNLRDNSNEKKKTIVEEATVFSPWVVVVVVVVVVLQSKRLEKEQNVPCKHTHTHTHTHTRV